MDFFQSNTFWTAVSAIAAIFAALAAAGFFRKEQIVKGELYTTQQERDDWRKKYYGADTRLDAIDPERFIDKADELEGQYEDLEKLALSFTEKQTEAFGRAAAIMAEQRIWDSDAHGEGALEEALRFVELGIAADPKSRRLRDLKTLGQLRNDAIKRGEPIETLNWEGMTGKELNGLSLSLENAGKFELAEIAARRTVAEVIFRHGETSRNAATSLSVHGVLLERLGRFKEAEAVHQRALSIRRHLFAVPHPHLAESLNNLATLFVATKRHSDAEPLLREALEIKREVNGPNHPETIATMANLALTLNHDWEAAESLLREALCLCEVELGPMHATTAVILGDLAVVLTNVKKFEEAEGLHRQAIAANIRKGKDSHLYAWSINNFAHHLTVLGNYNDAYPLFKEALSILEGKFGPDHPNTKATLENLNDLLTHLPNPPPSSQTE